MKQLLLVSSLAVTLLACGKSQQMATEQSSDDSSMSLGQMAKKAGPMEALEFESNGPEARILTADEATKASLESAGSGWQKTGMSFGLFGSPNQYSGLSPVCGFYIPSTGSYFYTALQSECDQFKQISAFQFRRVEGYALYVHPAECPSDLNPIYRLFKSQSSRGTHRYVSSYAEVQQLQLQGWSNEGIAFCVPVFESPEIPSTSTLSDRSHDQYRLLGNSTIWTVKLVVNAADTTQGKPYPAGLNFGEAPAAQRAFRKVVIARSACDMSSSAGNIVLTTNSNSGGAEFRLNEPSRAGANVPNLSTGVYYINIQNTSCPAGQYCDALIEWVN